MPTLAERTRATARFYDRYWPAHVPQAARTLEHVRAIVPPGRYRRALDAGCGTGVCTLALGTLADEVVGVDISPGSLAVARRLADGAGTAGAGCSFRSGSLLDLPFPDAHFDLVYSWGVVHHTADPRRAIDELVRVLAPGGTLVLAVYLRTAWTPLHEAIRRTCLRLPAWGRRALVAAVAAAARASDGFHRFDYPRADVAGLRAQVEDWYFVPEKHFFRVAEMEALFHARGLDFELVLARTGRFASTSNFICRGRRIRVAAGGRAS